MKKIIIIGLLPLVVGCSGYKTRAIDHDTLPTLKNKTLSLVVHESPGFMAITSDKDLFTKAGFDAAYADGHQLVKKNRIHDPADKICKKMAKVISTQYGLSYNENSIVKSQAKNMGSLVHLANGRDYILDVETVSWSFAYKVNLPDYYVQYNVKARLIDVNKATSIGRSSCDYDSVIAGKQRVSYAKLVENNAAYIKQTLNDASTYCVNKFKTDFFTGL